MITGQWIGTDLRSRPGYAPCLEIRRPEQI